MYLSVGLLTTQQPTLPKEKASVTRKDHSAFYNIILNVTYHSFCCILLVTQTNPVQYAQVGEYQEAEIAGGFLRGWLPPPLNSFSEQCHRCSFFFFFALILELRGFEMIIVVYNLQANERHPSIKINV